MECFEILDLHFEFPGVTKNNFVQHFLLGKLFHFNELHAGALDAHLPYGRLRLHIRNIILTLYLIGVFALPDLLLFAQPRLLCRSPNYRLLGMVDQRFLLVVGG